MSTPPWLNLSFLVPDRDVELLEAVLEAAGALAVSCEAEDDVPIFDQPGSNEPRLWPRCRITGLFDAAADRNAVAAAVARAGLECPIFAADALADEPWHTRWMAQFEPVMFGAGLCVCPTWREPLPGARAVVRLDPGMAFGTGTHPTTGLCLDWLAREGFLAGRRVLDYGCGSGILAIAALKCGAREVVAVDIDEDALRVTRENAALNGCPALRVLHPDALAPGERYDVLVANLLQNPLLALREEFRARLVPGGALGVSGLLEAQAATILAAYTAPFTMDSTQTRGGWAFIAGHLAG
ncbi:MAG: 50S ribosomal protein L11 methyltransferase [Gammaproteobacteria bacterium]|nr:50S ribosomal protein L11 methyltransferase [Gammaproteobacteria bacterium]